MNNHVTQSELHDLAMQLKDLVAEIKLSNKTTQDLVEIQKDQGKRIHQLEIQSAEDGVIIGDIKMVKRYIIGAIVAFIGSACAIAYTIGHTSGGM